MLTHATTRMNHENVVLSKRIQTHGHMLCDCIYMKCPEHTNLDTENRSVVPTAGGGDGKLLMGM